MEMKYLICTRCIMDTTDPEIEFDENGVCNHCRAYDELYRGRILEGKEGEEKLGQIVDEIKVARKDYDYDVIIGLSGGVDSSYALVKTIEVGLRPVAVHFDSGWNSELAVKNIENLVKKLGVDLYTFVIDWEEMRDLQLAFFYASLANCDIPQDQAIFAALYQVANEKDIQYVVNGTNFATESILPKAWGYDALDCRHIKAIQKRFGTMKLKRYPLMSFYKRFIYYPYIKRMKTICILNYMRYVKKEAMEILKRDYAWKYYGGKHYESIFTRFFQGYYLPAKFGYDKRKGHLSSLIVSGQMTRDEALKEMKNNYYTEEMMREDTMYVQKKLRISKEVWKRIMTLPLKTFRDYPSNRNLMLASMGPYRLMRMIFPFLKLPT